MEGLTLRQASILRLIESHVANTGRPPTMRRLGELAGIRSTNAVNDHLAALERKGYIERQPLRSCAIRVLRPTLQTQETAAMDVAESAWRLAEGHGSLADLRAYLSILEATSPAFCRRIGKGETGDAVHG